MILSDITSRFLRYNLWANERLTSWLLTLERDTLYKETGSSFGTIAKTMHHMLLAEKYWHALLVHGEIKDFGEPDGDAFESIAKQLVEASNKLIADLSALTEAQWSEPWRASDSTQSRYEYILHVVNHASYHRGQVVSMSRILGVKGDIPVLDYDGYLWWLENK